MTRPRTGPAHPFAFFDLGVCRSERLGPGMVRIAFGVEPAGGSGTEFVSAGRDQRFKLFFPHPHQGLDRRAVAFTGYWRRGASEEDLLAEYAAGASPATEE